MDIIMFTPYFYPHIGGVEKHVQRISEELIMRGHNVTIITQKHTNKLLNSEKIGKIKVFRIDASRVTQIWIWIYKHKKLIKKADIVHFHDYGTFIYWYLPFRFLYPLKNYYITFHGYEGMIPIPKKIIYLRKITELLTNGNICIGSFIPKWYGTNANFISLGGVDRFKLTSEDKQNIKKKSALYIGRLENDTGIWEYLIALKILKENNINIKMDICGDGTLKEDIEIYIKENKLNATIHGFTNNTDRFLATNYFTFLSGYLTILEAMISKKLVFSVYSDSLRRDYLLSIPNSADMMIITNSPTKLAKKIAFYYKNPAECTNMVENAYNFAKNQSWAKLADYYLKLWEIN